MECRGGKAEKKVLKKIKIDGEIDGVEGRLRESGSAELSWIPLLHLPQTLIHRKLLQLQQPRLIFNLSEFSDISSRF